MALNHPGQGESFTGAYAISATPYVTSSAISLGQIKEISFGWASKFLIIKNTGAASTALAVSFTQNGLKPAFSNYFILSGSESFGADLRVNKVYLSGSVGASTTFSVVGGLTFIPEKNMIPLTGSSGFPGVG